MAFLMFNSFLFFFLMFLLSSMGQVISDVYLPALPQISADLNTTVHAVQISIALYFFGFAISHLVYGPISDSSGRKKPLAIGIIICAVGSIICQYTTHIQIFNAGRLIQGIGAGSSAVLYRSILRDLYNGNKLAKISSYLGIGRIVLLASSPLIGAYITSFFGWRACFFFLFLYSAVSLLGSHFLLKETNAYTHLHNIKIPHLIKNCRLVLSSSIFLGYTLIIMLTFGGILCWLTTLPIVLQTTVGLTPIQFGWLAALVGLFFAIGGVINAFSVTRFGINFMITIGLFAMLFAGGLMLLLGLMGHITATAIMVPVIVFIFGSSLIFPNAYAGAFQPFPEVAGMASALFGFLQILGGAISSTIMSYTETYDQIPLSVALLSISLVGLVIAGTLIRNKSPLSPSNEPLEK